jgi:septal ring factor EnvC (AmiA/AmiB activator)
MHRSPTTFAATALLLAGAALAQNGAATAAAPTVDDTRVTMGKWIETQQILAKERKDWQQGKEVLVDLIDLRKKEIASLEEKIKLATAAAESADKKRADLAAEIEKLAATDARLVEAVAAMEGEVKKLCKALPESLLAKVQPLLQRMPTEATTVRVSAAERFQNVLVILTEVNRHNSEITVDQEVRTLPDGKRVEVQAIYAGLGQAWFVSASGYAGVGRPTADGWKWEQAAIARQVLTAIEIVQGKQTPAFVPLPVRLQ